MLKKKHHIFLIIALTLTGLFFNELHTRYRIKKIQQEAARQYSSPDQCPEVVSALQPQFDRLNNILVGADVRVDFFGIEKILAAPLGEGAHGYYLFESKVIAIESAITAPQTIFSSLLGHVPAGIKADDYLLVVLAHEVAHANGVGHSQDTTSLMYYNTRHVPAQVKKEGPEEFILRTFRSLDSLRAANPLAH